MKNPFRPGSRLVNNPAKAGEKSEITSADSSRDVQAFLDKVKSIPATAGDARLVFALDATASRQATWDVASKLQASMFQSAQALGGLNLQLCYFRGFAEFYSSAWQADPDQLLGLMSRIHCEAGATQLERVLRHALKENRSVRLKGVVFIGDAVEESFDSLADLAGKLGLMNVPLFMFQERNDPHVQQVFRHLANVSGGAYAQFDAGSADQLRELLRAVAVYAAGGLKALSDLGGSSGGAARLLEHQLKARSR